MNVSSCYCDSTFYWDPNTCVQQACFAYHLWTEITFGILSCCCLWVMYANFVFTRRFFEVRKIAVLLILLFCILRVVRYAILVAGVELTPPLYPFLTAIYILPWVLGFASYTLLIFSWMRLYHSCIAANASGLRNEHRGVLGGWLPWYVATQIGCLMIYIILTILYSINAQYSQALLDLWAGLVALGFGLFFVFYGRKVNQQLAMFNNNAVFKKLHRFTWLNTIQLFSTVVIIWVLGVIAVLNINASVWFFLLRQWIYRAMETVSALLFLFAFHPSWSDLRTEFFPLRSRNSSIPNK